MSEQLPQPPTTADETLQLVVLKPEFVSQMKIGLANSKPELMPCNNRGDEFTVGPASATLDEVILRRQECLGCPYRQPCLFDAVVRLVKHDDAGELLAGATTPRQRVATDKEVKKAMGQRGTNRTDVRIGSLFLELMKKGSDL